MPPMSDLLNNSHTLAGGFTEPALNYDELLSRNGHISNPQEHPIPTSVDGMTAEPKINVTISDHPLRPTKIPSVPERPNWLPEGWIFEHKIRTSGASAGLYDRYYIEPSSRHRFRSRKEVEYFLKTGSIKRPAFDAADVAPAVAVSSAPAKDDNNNNNKGEAVGWAFDPKCVPGHVRWSLADSSTDRWDAFIGAVIVNQPTIKIWKDFFAKY